MAKTIFPRIALIPLDDRPCNFKFPDQIMAMAGQPLVLPPKNLLGRFRRPGKPGKILKWLAKQAPRLDVVVISVDMLAYGGLVASRDPKTTLATARRRLSALAALRKRFPHLTITLFNSIMRLSITAASEADETAWAQIFEYSQIEDPKKRNEFGKRIPAKVLKKYLTARRRNHEVNKAAIRLVKNGLADFLVFGREDVAPTGLHRAEERMLWKEAGPNPNIFFMNGTDEIGQMLPIAHLLAAAKKRPAVRIVYSRPRGRHVVSLYEDVPISRAVADHIRLLDGQIVSSRAKADFTLFVHTPEKSQRDLFMSPMSDAEWGRVNSKKEAAALRKEISARRAVSVADVAYANGGDWSFLKNVLPSIKSSDSILYAAWNTTSNTLGTALASACAAFILRQELLKSEKPPSIEISRREFLADRLLDDGYYQSQADRRKIGAKIAKHIPHVLKRFFPYASLRFLSPWGRPFEIS